MQRRSYPDELKQQIGRECQQVGKASLVAPSQEISPKTVANWIRAAKTVGSPSRLPRDKEERLKEVERRLKVVSAENDQLKRLVAEKELELSILRDLKKLQNPR